MSSGIQRPEPAGLPSAEGRESRLALAAFVRPSLASMTVIIGVISWMDVTRMVRSQMLTLRERECVLGARALGASASRILAHVGARAGTAGR